MPKSYSVDLRKRVIEAVEAGASRREAAESFGIDASSAVRWLQRWMETGSCAPKPRGGSVSRLEQHAEQILALVAQQPDLTLEETIAELLKRRIRTSKSAVSRFFQRHDITFKKKSLRAAEQHRADVARARRRWIREQGMLDPARLVFIDETAVTTKMVRLWGRGPRGIELIGRAPCGEWRLATAPVHPCRATPRAPRRNRPSRCPSNTGSAAASRSTSSVACRAAESPA